MFTLRWEKLDVGRVGRKRHLVKNRSLKTITALNYTIKPLESLSP